MKKNYDIMVDAGGGVDTEAELQDMYKQGAPCRITTFKEEMPPSGDVLTSIGWLTRNGDTFSYRGLSNMSVNITSETEDIWWVKPE